MTNKTKECPDRETAMQTLETFKERAYYHQQLWFQQCPLPCSKTVYDMKLLKYHKNSNIGLEVEKAKNIHNLAIYFKFDYETFAVEEFTETLIYDTGNFLTQLGGNLGLFLGFSCFSLLQGIMNIFVHQ